VILQNIQRANARTAECIYFQKCNSNFILASKLFQEILWYDIPKNLMISYMPNRVLNEKNGIFVACQTKKKDR